MSEVEFSVLYGNNPSNAHLFYKIQKNMLAIFIIFQLRAKVTPWLWMTWRRKGPEHQQLRQ